MPLYVCFCFVFCLFVFCTDDVVSSFLSLSLSLYYVGLCLSCFIWLNFHVRIVLMDVCLSFAYFGRNVLLATNARFSQAYGIAFISVISWLCLILVQFYSCFLWIRTSRLLYLINKRTSQKFNWPIRKQRAHTELFA